MTEPVVRIRVHGPDEGQGGSAALLLTIGRIRYRRECESTAEAIMLAMETQHHLSEAGIEFVDATPGEGGAG